MRTKWMKLMVLILTGICCLSGIAACSSDKKPAAEQGDGQDVMEAPSSSESDQDAEGGSDLEGESDLGEEDSLDQVIPIGDFSTQDIYGEDFTQDVFADYQLTMVNVFATWCGPCIKEIPDLQQLSQDMADQGVHVVGIVLDTRGTYGDVDEEAVEKAKLLAEQLEVSYPFLIPDKGYLNGMLLGVSAVPTTFFVDKEGNLVGEAYMGSRSLKEWTSIVEAQLEEVSQ